MNKYESISSNQDFIYNEKKVFKESFLSSLLAGKNNALTISLFIVSFCFLLIGGVGYEVSKILKSSLENPNPSIVIVGYIGIFLPLIASFFISRKLTTINPMVIVGMLVLFVIGNIIGFSFIFLRYDVASDWLLSFAIAGGVFVVAAIIGFFGKWINKIWKYIVILSVIWLILMMVLLILRFTNTYIIADVYLIMTGIFGILTIFYIIFGINKLKNFHHIIGQERYSINVILYISFLLLVNLINLVLIFLSFLKK